MLDQRNGYIPTSNEKITDKFNLDLRVNQTEHTSTTVSCIIVSRDNY